MLLPASDLDTDNKREEDSMMRKILCSLFFVFLFLLSSCSTESSGSPDSDKTDGGHPVDSSVLTDSSVPVDSSILPEAYNPDF